jgi:integrase/recombinase XerD
MNLASLEQAFITERRYLKNVTRKTLSWYACSFSAFRPFLANVKGEDDLKPMVKTAVLELAERGLSPVSINVYLRCLNAFMKWLHDEEHIGVPIRIAPLKTEKKVLAVLTPEQVQQLVAYRPRGKNEIRAHTLALLILDTGMRADEALNVRKQDVDLDNLLVTVIKGKGQKQRIVPFSFQLRRVLFKHSATQTVPHSELVFCTSSGKALTQRNALRDLKGIGQRIGAPHIRFHLLRHTFATEYIRTGGSVAMLRKILGHSSIATTMIYEHLQTEDLKNVHHQHSILASTH